MRGSLCATVCAVGRGVLVAWVLAGARPARAETFEDFRQKDRAAYRAFLQGQTNRPAPARAAPVRNPSFPDGQSAREQAIWLFKQYRELERGLNAPHIPDDDNPSSPGSGGSKAIAQVMEEKLYPHGPRFKWFDQVFWFGGGEYARKYEALRQLRETIRSDERKMDRLVERWNELGLGEKLGPLRVLYGMVADQKWDYERKEFVTGPFEMIPVIIDSTWPPGGAAPKPPPPGHPPAPDAVIEPDGLGGGEAPAGLPEIVAQPPPVPPARKPWEEMTPAERHAALKANDPEAWLRIGEMLLGTNLQDDAQQAAEMKQAAVAGTPPPVETPPPEAVPAAGAAGWDRLTANERHEALKRGDLAAWWAMREALLSGDGSRVNAVVEALGARAVPADVLTLAYFASYRYTLLKNNASTPPSSGATSGSAGLEAIIGPAAVTMVYAVLTQFPALSERMEQGRVDAEAGQPPRYPLPTAISPEAELWLKQNAPGK